MENSRQNTRFRWRFAKNLENAVAVDDTGNVEFARDVTSDGLIKQEGALQRLVNCGIDTTNPAIEGADLSIYSDGYSYIHVCGYISVYENAEPTVALLKNIPAQLSAHVGSGATITSPATNSAGGAGHITCAIENTTISININAGAERTVYVNFMFGPQNTSI